MKKFLFFFSSFYLFALYGSDTLLKQLGRYSLPYGSVSGNVFSVIKNYSDLVCPIINRVEPLTADSLEKIEKILEHILTVSRGDRSLARGLYGAGFSKEDVAMKLSTLRNFKLSKAYEGLQTKSCQHEEKVEQKIKPSQLARSILESKPRISGDPRRLMLKRAMASMLENPKVIESTLAYLVTMPNLLKDNYILIFISNFQAVNDDQELVLRDIRTKLSELLNKQSSAPSSSSSAVQIADLPSEQKVESATEASIEMPFSGRASIRIKKKSAPDLRIMVLRKNASKHIVPQEA